MKRRTLIGAAPFVVFSALVPAADCAFAAQQPESYDVIVVGAGGAGLAAALSASETGARVLVLEKAEYIGGDTLVSGGYFNAPASPQQAEFKIEDSAELFYQHMMTSGQGLNSPEVVRTLTGDAAETVRWLAGYGVHFEEHVYQIYGSGYPRCLHPTLPRGSAYIQVLSDACLMKGVRILTGMTVTELTQDARGRVTGVVAHDKNRRHYYSAGRGVVLAAGGFGANRRMVERYAPKMAEFPVDTTNTSTGEVLEAAVRIGAQTANMTVIECIPEGATSPGQSVRIYTVLQGLIFVNSKGERFVDESAERNDLTSALLKEGPEKCFTIVDSQNVGLLDEMQQKNLYRALFAGQAWKDDTLKGLAEALGIPYQSLNASIAGLPSYRRPKTGPFWAVRMHPWIHYTLGGLVITPDAQCVDGDGKPIAGLYAAGQITGNVHGANRLGGNGLTDAIVFGRIAGCSAAQK